jgi:hypothetical protein
VKALNTIVKGEDCYRMIRMVGKISLRRRVLTCFSMFDQKPSSDLIKHENKCKNANKSVVNSTLFGYLLLIFKVSAAILVFA